MEIKIKFNEITKNIDISYPDDAPEPFIIAAATALMIDVAKRGENIEDSINRLNNLSKVGINLLQTGTISGIVKDSKNPKKSDGKTGLSGIDSLNKHNGKSEGGYSKNKSKDKPKNKPEDKPKDKPKNKPDNKANTDKPSGENDFVLADADMMNEDPYGFI